MKRVAAWVLLAADVLGAVAIMVMTVLHTARSATVLSTAALPFQRTVNVVQVAVQFSPTAQVLVDDDALTAFSSPGMAVAATPGAAARATQGAACAAGPAITAAAGAVPDRVICVSRARRRHG